jgi:hypothetical protein
MKDLAALPTNSVHFGTNFGLVHYKLIKIISTQFRAHAQVPNQYFYKQQ